MELKEELLKYLVKEGPSLKDGNRVWDIGSRKFLYMNPELVEKFLAMRNHDRYKELVINKEIEMLKESKDFLVDSIGKGNFNLIDLGCGDGQKAKVFIELLNDCQNQIKFCPVSVSEELVNLTLENVKKENFPCVKDYTSKIACFQDADGVISELRNSEYQGNVVLLLGSILASFDVNDYLFKLSNSMFPGDILIIGNGIRKGERLVNLETYKHPVFKDWTLPLMKELGFKENEVEYDVKFNHVRIELVYKLKVDKEVEIEGKKISFKAGDDIMVAKIYKYFSEELEKFCKFYFSDVKLLPDSENEYALVVCKK
ncbi:hypothetical protein CMI45_01945 [Candidatus Pacearchaeota archaeon]|nr:hypothetical protein [Candidatus Pacearchaeota archaeon]|tara:strand:+ start:244 stop:1185 length:942 start_codon:yes stop_codon:yes gene_type:complete